MLLSEHKKRLMCLKQKDWSKRKGHSSYLNQVPWSPQQTIPDHRLYLSYSSKNSSAEHIHTLPTCLTLINTHSHRRARRRTRTTTRTHAHTHTHTHTYARRDKPCIRRENMFGWGILDLYGKVEAVVRNCLLMWSRHLVEVVGSPLYDHSFCFKHISLFSSPIRAFFHWYPPFPCYTKDFTCRCEVTLNPCSSITNQDFEK